MLATLPSLINSDFPPLCRDQLQTLQVNLGYKCNQQCLHCHVNAGPQRSEMMDAATIDLIVRVLAEKRISCLDITGGAPELHPEFRHLVLEAKKLNCRVIDRCNLTVLLEPGQEGLAEFLAQNQIEIVASLPCYTQQNVDQQRGDGVFEKSIAVLQKLNRLGYAQAGSNLILNLVYNPQGPVLPGPQAALEADYKVALQNNYGISFNQLLTITNMPIQRFGSALLSKKQFNDYLQLLRDNFSEQNLEQVMCRSLLSVDWQGYLFDCDFNQQLGLPLCSPLSHSEANEELSLDAGRPHLRDLLDTEFAGNPIRVAEHCYGCTAGQGSSCGGAMSS